MKSKILNLKPSFNKYQKAEETGTYVYSLVVEKTNCNNPNGHQFGFVDQEEAKEIRKEHPTWVIALWKCHYCGKIKQSM